MTRKMFKQTIVTAVKKGIIIDRKTGKMHSLTDEEIKNAQEYLKLINLKDEVAKRRFDYLKKVTKGYSNRMSTPLKGKNKNQRRKIVAGWSCMNNSQKVKAHYPVLRNPATFK